MTTSNHEASVRQRRLPARGPSFAVIIPTKNSATTVEKAILSVLRQSFRNFELIVADDESTDKTCEIIEQLSAQETSVTFLGSDACGPGGARNIALQHARGDIIVFLDSDDELSDAALFELAKVFRTLPIEVATFNHHGTFKYSIRTERLENSRRYLQRQEIRGFLAPGPLAVLSLLKRHAYRHECTMFAVRRNYLLRKRIRSPENRIHEDILFTLKCQFSSRLTLHLAKPLYYRSYRRESTTGTVSERSLRDLDHWTEITQRISRSSTNFWLKRFSELLTIQTAGYADRRRRIVQ